MAIFSFTNPSLFFDGGTQYTECNNSYLTTKKHCFNGCWSKSNHLITILASKVDVYLVLRSSIIQRSVKTQNSLLPKPGAWCSMLTTEISHV